MRKTTLIIAMIFWGYQTSFAQFSKTKIGKMLESTVGKPISTMSLSNDEIVSGLKEALSVGISNGSAKASALDGYLKNPQIRIPVPPEARILETRLRQIGMGKQVDQFVMSMNRAAEDAAKQAKPIFVKAIFSMSFQDALSILRGDSTAATSYLQKTTSPELLKAFMPVIDSTLAKNKTTQYYTTLASTYNQLPFVTKVNPDVKQYATQKAVDGLFLLIAQEEQKIRKDPLARATDLLKKVFSAK